MNNCQKIERNSLLKLKTRVLISHLYINKPKILKNYNVKYLNDNPMRVNFNTYIIFSFYSITNLRSKIVNHFYTQLSNYFDKNSEKNSTITEVIKPQVGFFILDSLERITREPE